MLNEFANRLRLFALFAIEVVEHLFESPLRPMIVFRVAGTHFAVPVKRETNFVQLFAIALNICFGSYSRMLSCLNRILLCGQSIGIITHRVQHVIATRAFIACIDIACNIAEGVSYVKSSPRRIGKHIEHIEFLLCVISFHMICLFCGPSFLPLLFDFYEIIFHSKVTYSFLCCEITAN